MASWIIWITLAVELLKLMQSKNKGEKFEISEILRLLSSLGINDDDVNKIKKLLPDIMELIGNAELLKIKEGKPV